MSNENWDILNSLDMVTIVATSPRPGTDFLQSLLDFHPQVLTFDGWLFFHEFYYRAHSVYGTKSLLAGVDSDVDGDRIDNINIRHFFYEFAWSHLHKFNSKYDDLESKELLGKDHNECNVVDIDVFVDHAVCLIGNNEFTSRNALLTTYGAFSLARGEDLKTKKILLHQVHWPEYIPHLIRDFPELKVIACVRDPRIWGVTIMKYHNSIYHLSQTSIGSVSAFFRASVDGFNGLEKIKDKNIRINVLEKLHDNPEKILRSLSSWLGITFSDVLLKSTWNGKIWNGDSVSVGINKVFDSSRYKNTQKQWLTDLSIVDRIVMGSLMRKEIRNYKHNQEFNNAMWQLLVPLLILVWTKYEVKLFFAIIRQGKYKFFPRFFKTILSRYFFSYRKFVNNIMGNSTIRTCF